MTLVALNKGDFTQIALLGTAIGPAFMTTLHLLIPELSIDVYNAVIGQTEPPLARKIDAQTVTDLGLNDTDFAFHLRVVRRDDSAVKVDTGAGTPAGGTVTFTLQSDGSAVLAYEWQGGELDATGVHGFQFRAVQAADNRVLYWEDETLIVRNP